MRIVRTADPRLAYLPIRIVGPQRCDRRIDVVARPTQLDVVAAHERPVRPGRLLPSGADAAGVDDPISVDSSIELRMRVPDHDDALLDPVDHLPQRIVGGEHRDGLVDASRRPMRVEHVAEHEPLGKAGDEVALVGSELCNLIGDVHVVQAVHVAEDETRIRDGAGAIDHLDGLRAAVEIPAEHDDVGSKIRYLGEDGVERREVAFYVVEGGDAHAAETTAASGAARSGTATSASGSGVTAATMGRDSDADEHFEFACRFHDDNALRLWSARSHLGWSEALAARGQHARAQEHASRAVELARAHGYGLIEALAAPILGVGIG